MCRFRGFLILLIAIVSLVACSSPLDSEDSGQTGDVATATPTIDMPEFRVVTPTPVDPNSIPPDATATPGFIDVPNTYVVQEGDSLYSIAAQFGLELSAIVELNQLADPNDIFVGQELQLPDPAGQP